LSLPCLSTENCEIIIAEGSLEKIPLVEAEHITHFSKMDMGFSAKLSKMAFSTSILKAPLTVRDLELVQQITENPLSPSSNAQHIKMSLRSWFPTPAFQETIQSKTL